MNFLIKNGSIFQLLNLKKLGTKIGDNEKKLTMDQH
jgi:hypothetical protein